MNAYIYQADIYCEKCAKEIRRALLASGKAPDEDSGRWPQGPYSNGGGEADCPQHCGGCSLFLKNPLTGDGVAYVKEKLTEASGDMRVLNKWADYYGDALGLGENCPDCGMRVASMFDHVDLDCMAQ